MAKNTASLALFLALNILFFTMASACGGGCVTPSPPSGGSGGGSSGGSGGGSSGGSGGGSSGGSCPRDALKLGVCANLLNLLKLKVGNPPTQPCCSLIDGLLDLEAAVCLCTVLKVNLLGININLPVDLSLVIDACGKKVPKGFQCP